MGSACHLCGVDKLPRPASRSVGIWKLGQRSRIGSCSRGHWWGQRQVGGQGGPSCRDHPGTLGKWLVSPVPPLPPQHHPDAPHSLLREGRLQKACPWRPTEGAGSPGWAGGRGRGAGQLP